VSLSVSTSTPLSTSCLAYVNVEPKTAPFSAGILQPTNMTLANAWLGYTRTAKTQKCC